MNLVTPTRTEAAVRSVYLYVLTLAALALAGAALYLGSRERAANLRASELQSQVAALGADRSQLQADLDRSRQSAAELLAKLEKSTAMAGVLQSRLDKARADRGDLEVQLQNLKSDTASQLQALGTQMDAARTRMAELKQQADNSAVAAAQLAAQLGAAADQASELRGKLAKDEDALAKLQLVVSKARKLPVTTTLDAGSLGSSLISHRNFTLRINNLQTQPLQVEVTIDGQAGQRVEKGVIEPTSSYSVEKLASGETVSVSSTGYDPIKVAVQ